MKQAATMLNLLLKVSFLVPKTFISNFTQFYFKFHQILFQINTKCGGQNLSIPSKFRSPVMSDPVIVLGADVTHPATGEFARPSVAAIVGSMDPVPCKFQGLS